MTPPPDPSTSEGSRSSSPPKLAYLINAYPMPSQTFIRREMAGLERLGWHVVRFAIRPGQIDQLVDPDDRREAERSEYLLESGLICLVLQSVRTALRHPRRWLRAVLRCGQMARRSDRAWWRHLAYFLEACQLKQRCDHLRIERLHVHFGTNSATVALLCRDLGGPPYSLTVHGPEEFDRPCTLAIEQKVNQAAFCVAVSQFTRSQLYRWTDWSDWARIHVVHCTVCPSDLDHEPTPPPDAPRLVSIGRLADQKGQRILIQAARQLADSGVPFQIDIIGDGPLRDALQDQIVADELENRVALRGWQSRSKIQVYLHASRALVLASFAEGLPVVLMEALARGRPVIATHIAGIPELVRHEQEGWLVPAGSATALADAMQHALTCPPTTLARMGQAGRQRVFQRHHPDREPEKLARLLLDETGSTGWQ